MPEAEKISEERSEADCSVYLGQFVYDFPLAEKSSPL